MPCALAFVVGFAAIAWFLKFLVRHSMYWFVGYRLVLGGHPDRHARLWSEAFGVLSEKFARFMGTPRFLIWMTIFVAVWLAWNTFAPESAQFDPRALNYTLLTLILIGFPLLLAFAVWFIVRCVKGFKGLQEKRAPSNVDSWLL